MIAKEITELCEKLTENPFRFPTQLVKADAPRISSVQISTSSTFDVESYSNEEVGVDITGTVNGGVVTRGKS